uniref:RNA-directed RNA polymerase L n=1 Tax=Switchgrass phenui-like virus 1 TaxID=3233120 RepID=A0AAU8MGM4_9VIRU
MCWTNRVIKHSKSQQSICKHYRRTSFEDECFIMCNDSLKDGYCYLKPIEDKLSAYEELGKYPKFTDILKYVQKPEIKCSPFSIINRPISHLIIEGDIIEEPFEMYYGCENCKRTGKRHVPYFTQKIQRCSQCKTNLKVLFLPATRFCNVVVGSNITYTEKEFLSDPQTYYYEGRIETKLIPFRNENTISIKTDKGRLLISDEIYGKRIKNVRHDYISNECEEETDKKLSSIGVEHYQGNLTPDFIDPVSKKVVEIGTCNSQYHAALMSMYNSKVLKYKDIVESVNGSLAVVIIGINRVVTNLKLDRPEYIRLINRFMEITSIEPQITQLCGVNIFKDKDNDDERLSKMIFNEFKYKPLEDKQYNLNSLMRFQNTPTKEDIKKASVILEQELKKSKISSCQDKSDFLSYLSKFDSENSRLDMKRICNIPMIIPSEENSDHVNSLCEFDEDMPMSMQDLWYHTAKHEVVEPTREEVESGTHVNKKRYMFNPRLSESSMEELSLKGIGAKQFEGKFDKLDTKQSESKKSFSPDVYTGDIESFVSIEWLNHAHKNIFVPDILIKTVELSKLNSTMSLKQESVDIWKNSLNNKFMSFCFMISYLFTEISYCYKHWTPAKTFMRKNLKFGITLLIYNPKSHLFVSFCFPRKHITILEQGKIGPTLYNCGDFVISDFCSFNEPTLEHFVKSGPYMNSIYHHLQSATESKIGINSEYTVKSLNHILLLYLNNKTDLEELITSQRYLTMKVLEDIDPNPWVFVKRLPSVMRSRLTVYYLWRTFNMMEFYTVRKIIKIPENVNGMVLYNYKNIKSIFTDQEISLNLKINEFYFGYVISKERGRGGDRMFKVLSKMIEQEYSFRDSDPEPFTSTFKTPKFASNENILKIFSHNFANIIKCKLGDNFKEKLYEDFISEVAYTNFNKLATLKASSRTHDEPLRIDELKTSELTRQQIQNIIDKDNKKEVEKRPKMIAAIIDLVDKYKTEKGREPLHVVEMLPWCLDRLLKKKRFDSDCFAKPQHGGDREIHVLEVSMRIVQYHVELFARVVCKYFPSETTCNPDTKDNFVKEHYKSSTEKYNSYSTYSKSADATKWCQGHHTSHFAALYMAVAPEELKPFLINSLSLWPHKSLNFPTTLVSTLLKNMNLKNVSPLYNRFRHEFSTGTGMFSNKNDNKITFKSGMFQGILHTTSSLYHTMIQENMKMLVQNIYSVKMNINPICTVVQGSDDSGMMISVPGNPTKRSMRIAKTMLMWKENVSEHLSVYCSKEKSSIGTHDLIEYNSEWHSRHKIIKPTFRWISACLEVSVTEKFIDRFRIFNGILTQCLEGGASTLECALVQLNQACLHYMLLGFMTQDAAEEMYTEFAYNPDPSLGFFPCDYDIAAGVTGVEFQLYNLYKYTNFGSTLRNKMSTEMSLYYSQDHLPNSMKVKDLQSVKLRFCNMRIFETFVSSLPIDSLETALAKIEDEPELIFGRHTSWKEDQPNLTLKVFSSGVKDSISNVSPTLRMMASSAYILTEKCLSCFEFDEKMSLIELSRTLRYSGLSDKLPEYQIFPLYNEFARVLKTIHYMTNNMLTQDVIIRKSSKNKISVFEKPVHDIPIIDIAKQVWLGLGHVTLSSSQIRERWESITEMYPFLSKKSGKDGLDETCKNLNTNVVLCKQLLESLNTRTRNIVLYDSNSKSNSLSHTISRIYWPHVKIVTPLRESDDHLKLRSEFFAISTFWFSLSEKEKLINNLLLESDILNQPMSSIHPKLHKLKIFRDYLSGERKSSLISRITALKQGVIGCFTVRQHGFGINRSNYGEWVGQVCGVNVKIMMRDEYITNIEVAGMQDSIALGKALVNLINEFRMKFPENSINCYKLIENGRFKLTNRTGIPVIVNKQVSFGFVESLENWNWSLNLEDSNLRLKVHDNTGGKMSIITLLSETFTSKDWVQDNKIYSYDDLFNKWSNGDSITVEDFNTKVLNTISDRRIEMLNFFKRMKDHNTRGLWDFSSLRNTIIKSFGLNVKKTKTELSEEESSLNDNDHMELLSIVRDLDFRDFNFDETIPDWSEDVQNEEDIFCFEDDGSNMDDALDLFGGADYNETIFENSWDSNTTMPTSLKFFSFLNQLSIVHYRMSFKELYTKAKSDTNFGAAGSLGKVLSLVLLRYHVKTNVDLDESIVDFEQDSVQMAESVKTEEDVNKLDIDDLQAKRKEIENHMESLDPSMAAILKKSLDRVNHLIEMKESSSTSQVKVTFDTFMSELYSFLTCYDLIPEKMKLIDDMNHEEFAELMMGGMLKLRNSNYEIMTEHEKTLINYAMQYRIINSTLCNLLCNTFKFNMDKYNYTFIVDESFPTFNEFEF